MLILSLADKKKWALEWMMENISYEEMVWWIAFYDKIGWHNDRIL